MNLAKPSWLSAEAVSAAAAVAAVLVTLFTWWQGYRRRPKQPTEERTSDQERWVMLRRVRHKWIAGVLDPSLANQALLTLGLQPRPELLGLGGRARLQPGRPPQAIPADTPISEVFDKVGGGLLILGAPGAGKTTMLLQLARELLDRAELHPDTPIPVVVNLASWARERKPLDEWLIDELNVSYTVPRRLARAWIAQNTLTLLLDGLDEVAELHRPACVAQLNAWRTDHGLVPLVICSRTAEYRALAVAVRVEEAVELQPPTDQQVATYLGHLEATGTPLADIRAALSSDKELRDLLRSPLMLHVIALSYHGRSAPALQEPGSIQTRQARLWEAYVARMFEQRPLDRDSHYTSEQARSWLEWLAQALFGRDQTEFHLDRLTPEWLPTKARQRGVHLAIIIGAALCVSLAGALSSWLAGGTWIYWLFFGLIPAIVMAGAAAPAVGDLRPTERMHWSLQEFRRHFAARLFYWGGLAVLGVTFGGALAIGLSGGLLAALRAGLTAGLLLGLTSGLGAALAGGLVSELRDERTMPNEGIRRSARSALAVGLAVGLSAGLAIWLCTNLAITLVGTGNRSATIPITVILGTVFGVSTGLFYGGMACFQHYIVRAALVQAKDGPWKYGRFLEAMTQRLLLRRSANAYIFTHRLLRDHLAIHHVSDADAAGPNWNEGELPERR